MTAKEQASNLMAHYTEGLEVTFENRDIYIAGIKALTEQVEKNKALKEHIHEAIDWMESDVPEEAIFRLKQALMK